MFHSDSVRFMSGATLILDSADANRGVSLCACFASDWTATCLPLLKEPPLSTSSVSLNGRLEQSVRARDRVHAPGIDLPLVIGLVIAFGALIVGISIAGLEVGYFLQPTAAAIVLGATIGVILITTPGHVVLGSLRRLRDLFSPSTVNQQELVEEIVRIARITRQQGILGIEPLARKTNNAFLREGLLLAIDVKTRDELASALETELRMKERRGETDARTFEVAGGFAPTIGILGTVVGLIQVLRQFSNLELVAAGIGTAFLSTIYGLGLANLLLLPLAHRIRARAAQALEVQELILDGVLGIFDQVHPTLIRSRLLCYLRSSKAPRGLAVESGEDPAL
jgi:chemotaxis protein MotA